MLTEVAEKSGTFKTFFWDFGLVKEWVDNRSKTNCWFWIDVVGIHATFDRMDRHQLTSRLSVLGRENVNWLLTAELPLIAQIVSQIRVNWTQPVETQRNWRITPLGWKVFDLTFLKVVCLAIGEAGFTSPCALASPGEAALVSSALLASLAEALASLDAQSVLTSLLEAILAPPDNASK